MTMFDGIAWVYWLVGTLGVAGTIAAFWFAPVVATGVAKFLATFLFTTRIGNVILAAGVAFMVADINRSQRDAAEYEAKIASMQEQQIAAGKQRDAEITADTRAAVMAEIAKKRLSEAKLDSDVKEFTDALPEAPSAPSATAPDFRVGDASCRLRQLAGYAGCGRQGAAGGVPKARPKGGGARLPDWAQYRLPGLISRGSSRPAESQ
jgi:hypothetical protein